MKNKITLVTLLLLVVINLSAGVGGHKRKVLIIGIDGTRSDALQMAYTPNLDSIVTHGFSTFNSWHEDITWSGPSWSSIMCGVYHNKHGVTNNSYAGSNYNHYPYFPTRAKEIDSTFKCVEYVTWSPMDVDVYNDGWDQKIMGTDGYTQANGAGDIAVLQDPNIDCLFAYFDAVDITGHASGFSPTNSAYMQAIDTVDVQIGNLMAAIKARPSYAQEDWLVLIVTDHGGIGTGHGSNTFQERNIWWVGYSPRGVHYEFPVMPDPGSYNIAPDTVNIILQRQAPVQVDIATTALHHLIYSSGINPMSQVAWDLDGKSWLCEMGLCSEATEVLALQNELAVKVVPNPSFDANFTVYCENFDNKEVFLTVTDNAGRLIKKESVPTTSLKHQLNLSGSAKGVYYLTVGSGIKSTTKKIVIQ